MLEDIENGESQKLYIPGIIVETYVSNEGFMDIDLGFPIITNFIICDSFGYETRIPLTIYIDKPDSNPTTTTTSTTGDWETMIPIIGTTSIVGVIVILLGIRRIRK